MTKPDGCAARAFFDDSADTGKNHDAGILYCFRLELRKKYRVAADLRQLARFLLRARDEAQTVSQRGFREDLADFPAEQRFTADQCDGFSQPESPDSVLAWDENDGE